MEIRNIWLTCVCTEVNLQHLILKHFLGGMPSNPLAVCLWSCAPNLKCLLLPIISQELLTINKTNRFTEEGKQGSPSSGCKPSETMLRYICDQYHIPPVTASDVVYSIRVGYWCLPLHRHVYKSQKGDGKCTVIVT